MRKCIHNVTVETCPSCACRIANGVPIGPTQEETNEVVRPSSRKCDQPE